MNRPGMNFNVQGTKAKDSRKTLQTLLRYLEPYRVKIIVVMVFAALSSVFSIVGPKLLGKVTTKLAEGLIAYYLHANLYMDFDYMGRLIALMQRVSDSGLDIVMTETLRLFNGQPGYTLAQGQ